MKRVVLSLAVVGALGGCALTHEQVVERAHHKTNTELCMALIQFPQYADVIQAELDDRGRVCDMQVALAQVQEQNAQNDRYRAAIQAAAASFNAQPGYQVVPHTPLTAVAPVQVAAAPVATSATAYFTGQQRQVQTVTYQAGWNCEYRYAAQTFWRTFVGSCPSSIQVQ